jgi:hypothetical protein
MTMTRQHFQLIADVLHDAGLTDEDRKYLSTLFANKLATTNPNFDRTRFLKACGVET